MNSDLRLRWQKCSSWKHSSGTSRSTWASRVGSVGRSRAARVFSTTTVWSNWSRAEPRCRTAISGPAILGPLWTRPSRLQQTVHRTLLEFRFETAGSGWEQRHHPVRTDDSRKNVSGPIAGAPEQGVCSVYSLRSDGVRDDGSYSVSSEEPGRH